MKKLFCEICSALRDAVSIDIDMENHEEHICLECKHRIDRSM